MSGKIMAVLNSTWLVIKTLLWWDTYAATAIVLILRRFILLFCQEQLLEASKAVGATMSAAISIPIGLLALIFSLMDDSVKVTIARAQSSNRTPVIDTLFYQYGTVVAAWVIGVACATSAVVIGQAPVCTDWARRFLLVALWASLYVLFSIPSMLIMAKRLFAVMLKHRRNRMMSQTTQEAERGSTPQ